MALVMLLASQYSFQHIRQMEEQEDTPDPYVRDVGEKPLVKEVTAEETSDALLAKSILEKGVVNFDPNLNMPMAEDMDLEPAPVTVETTSTASIQYQFLEDINDEIPYNKPTEDFLVENPPTVTDTGPLGRAEWVERPVDNGPDFEGVRDVNTKKWIQTGPNFEPESWKDKEYVIVDGQQMHISAARTMMKSKQSQGYVQNEEQGESTKWNRVISCLLYTSPSPRDRTRSRMPSSA